MKFSIFNVFYFPIEKVVWNWEEVNEEFVEVYNFLISKGREVYLLTNNSVYSPRMYAEKFRERGLNIKEENIITSSVIAANHFIENNVGKVYAIGEYGLIEVLENNNIKISENADSVVIGIDRTLNYNKMKKAVEIIMKGGKVYLLDNATIWRVREEVFPASLPLLRYLQSIKDFDYKFLGRPSDVAKKFLLENVRNFMESTAFISPYLEDMNFSYECGFFSVFLTGKKIPKLDDNVKMKISTTISNLKDIIVKWE